MGCGASTTEDDTIKAKDPSANNSNSGDKSSPTKNGNLKTDVSNNNTKIENGLPDLGTKTPCSSAGSTNSKLRMKNKKNRIEPVALHGPTQPVPKAVAFDITLDNGPSKIDNIINKHPPKRLSRLDPITDVPKLTFEQLQEKIKRAEEKRNQELQKKKQKSRKASKKRQLLEQARNFEEQKQAEIDEKMKSADRNREKRLKAIEDKQRLREERAKRARERAKRLKADGGEDLDFEVEKDENYDPNDDSDSWLDGENNAGGDNNETHSDIGERIYSGRASPKKPYKPRSEAEQRARMSASTADSFDYAFQRKPPSSISRRLNDFEGDKDDFFDS